MMKSRWGVCAVALVLVAAACSGDDGSEEAGSTTFAPTTASVASTPAAPSGTSGSTTVAPTTTVAPSTTLGPSYDFSAVDEEVELYIAETGLNGAGLIIVDAEEGVLHHTSYGEFADDRVVLIASSSKMITAGVLMRLHEDGLLDIDAPVADVVDWGAANPDITPAQLVSNSSGLVGLNPGFGPHLCQFLAVGTLQDCAESIFTTPEDDAETIPPDTEFRYGGAQWQVAGAVAEAAAGTSWDQLIEEIYVEPCDLTSTAYNNHFAQFVSSGGVLGYPDDFGADPANLRDTDNPNMEGGVYSTTGDYGALLLMHLRGGMCGDERVISEESVARLHEDRILEAYGGSALPGTGYGMGWWIERGSGVIRDGGAYGAAPWIDLERGYGAYLSLEASSGHGGDLSRRIRPLIEEQIDAAP